MTERDKSGKWKPGQSGNPGGRSGQTQELRARLAEGADAVTKKVLAAAKKGDMQACRLILERLVPPIKPTSEPVQFELDDTDLPSATSTTPNTSTPALSLTPSLSSVRTGPKVYGKPAV
jgi:hypothetical protein